MSGNDIHGQWKSTRLSPTNSQLKLLSVTEIVFCWCLKVNYKGFLDLLSNLHFFKTFISFTLAPSMFRLYPPPPLFKTRESNYDGKLSPENSSTFKDFTQLTSPTFARRYELKSLRFDAGVNSLILWKKCISQFSQFSHTILTSFFKT